MRHRTGLRDINLCRAYLRVGEADILHNLRRALDHAALRRCKRGANPLRQRRIVHGVGERVGLCRVIWDLKLYVDAQGKKIARVESFRNIARLVRAGEKGSLSKGGMDSKLKAVKAAVSSGIDTYVANGRKSVLAPLLAGKPVGTFFPGSAL